MSRFVQAGSTLLCCCSPVMSGVVGAEVLALTTITIVACTHVLASELLSESRLSVV